MTIVEIPLAGKCLFTYEYFLSKEDNVILICSDEENTIKAHKQLEFFFGKDNLRQPQNLLYFRSLDTMPYDRLSPHQSVLSDRASVLSELVKNQTKSKKLLVTNAQNLLIKLPRPEIFAQNSIQLDVGKEISIESLAIFLVNNGFSRSSSAIENGEFATRGEILDLIINNEGYRINFAWNKIDSIRLFDPSSQISNQNVTQLDLSLASEGLLSTENINNFKNNFLKNFGVNHTNSTIYESITNGQKTQGYEHLLPLFYKSMASLTDYFTSYTIIYDSLTIPALLQTELSFNDFYAARIAANKLNPANFYYAVPPESLISSVSTIEEDLQKQEHILLKQETTKTFLEIPKISVSAAFEKKSNFDKLEEIIRANKDKTTIILCSAKSTLSRTKLALTERDFFSKEITDFRKATSSLINLAIAPEFGSFQTDKFLFFSESDITGEKLTTKNTKSSKRKLQNILLELDNIVENELIVHKDHGIGRFEKIENIKVSGIDHDCLKIIYADNDILYLPVENISLIKKYGQSEEELELDKLGRTAWQKRKAKLKNKIRDIASDLIKITAERHLKTVKPTIFDLEGYEKFCKAFPYTETEDQLTSIEEVTEDLQAGKLMDRLIVGDVGFGKTEVAMRAAFLVSSDTNQDEPQVAIISPTTILSKQHFNSFVERFAHFGFKIAHLSRLVKPSEAKIVKQNIENGSANIIIGTHALLSQDIKFKNLKLLIIDEEQHFGVAQKEKLKTLKSDVHILSLSATPIPRTLQMSMVGIKDLSLIATPPIDRLPVRTSVIPFDQVIIRDALMRERFRGGKSFYVCPRIKDIEWVKTKLNEIVPELKYKVAHGQMSPGQIDEIMTEFYDNKFDILLSTTIIESGIDIPSANTIIIHKSDMLGLSQLYQLRGRVGRSKVRGYAYLTLPNDKIINKHSLKRLEILQNIESLGAGFTIASHDMDLRGFGNLVGEEQSGHIKEVGMELYQEMLDEAISELKLKDLNLKSENEEEAEYSPIINLPIPVLIPAKYIEDSPLRLAIYRRTGALKSDSEIETFKYEMIDRFGPIPKEFDNLLEIVRIKHRCMNLKITNLDSGPNGFVLKFYEKFDVSNMVLQFVSRYPRHAKIKPDNKLVFLQKIDSNNVLNTTNELLSNLAPK